MTAKQPLFNIRQAEILVVNITLRTGTGRKAYSGKLVRE
jgi:hypothetical protein